MSKVLGFLHKHKDMILILGAIATIILACAMIYVWYKGKKDEGES